MKIFISYAREDEQFAKKLYHDIKNNGYDPWFDQECLRGGENWEERIKKELKNSRFCLALLTKASISKERGYIHQERKIALKEHDFRPDTYNYLIPVRIEECELPARYRW